MKFNVNGRERESYELSNRELVDLLKSNATNDEEKTALQKLLLEHFEYDLCPKCGESYDDVFVRFFSNFVNGKCRDKKHVAEKMSWDHRYLQNEMFYVCLEFIKKLAENCEKGFYDPRNRYACETSKMMIDALKSADYPF